LQAGTVIIGGEFFPYADNGQITINIARTIQFSRLEEIMGDLTADNLLIQL